MRDLRGEVADIVARMGYVGASIKIKESPACRRDQTRMPAFDVWVKPEGAARGRHLFTVVYPESVQ